MSHAAMNQKTLTQLQRDTFGYFFQETNRANGMVQTYEIRPWLLPESGPFPVMPDTN